MAKVRPIKAHAASRDANGGVTDTPSEFREFEAGDTLPIELGGTNATTAGGALTSLGVSAFMQTVLDDADAATARTTLGVTSGGGMFSGGTLAKSADYTVVAGDANKIIQVTANCTITIGAATNFAVGDIVGVSGAAAFVKVVSADAPVGVADFAYRLDTLTSGSLVVFRLELEGATKYWKPFIQPIGAPLFVILEYNGSKNLLADNNTWFYAGGTVNMIPRYTNPSLDFVMQFQGSGTSNLVLDFDNLFPNREINIFISRDGTAGTKTIDFTFAGASTYVKKSFAAPLAIGVNESWLFSLKTSVRDGGSGYQYIFINALKYS